MCDPGRLDVFERDGFACVFGTDRPAEEPIAMKYPDFSNIARVVTDGDWLQPLPSEPYVFARWKRARVAPDYHVEVDSSWYSVPFALIKQEVDVRVSGQTVEIFHRGQRVASHVRTPGRRNHVTEADHMPSAHRRLGEWTPARMLAHATKTGPAVAAFCEMVMADRPHPEQGLLSSPPRNAVTFWKSSKTATAALPLSSPANCPSNTGTRL